MTHLLTINTGSSSLKQEKFLIARHTYRIISHTGASRVSV